MRRERDRQFIARTVNLGHIRAAKVAEGWYGINKYNDPRRPKDSRIKKVKKIERCRPDWKR